MIFGVGDSAMIEDCDDGLSSSSLFLFVTDKKTWETEKCCNDTLDNEVHDVLGFNGFSEVMDGVFESEHSSITEEQIHHIMANLGWEVKEIFAAEDEAYRNEIINFLQPRLACFHLLMKNRNAFRLDYI